MAEVDARSVESSSVESSDEEPEQIGDNQDLPHTAYVHVFFLFYFLINFSDYCNWKKSSFL